jgi:hypothetical protein
MIAPSKVPYAYRENAPPTAWLRIFAETELWATNRIVGTPTPLSTLRPRGFPDHPRRRTP